MIDDYLKWKAITDPGSGVYTTHNQSSAAVTYSMSTGPFRIGDWFTIPRKNGYVLKYVGDQRQIKVKEPVALDLSELYSE